MTIMIGSRVKKKQTLLNILLFALLLFNIEWWGGGKSPNRKTQIPAMCLNKLCGHLHGIVYFFVLLLLDITRINKWKIFIN